jgi:hypothetical protein
MEGNVELSGSVKVKARLISGGRVLDQRAAGREDFRDLQGV